MIQSTFKIDVIRASAKLGEYPFWVTEYHKDFMVVVCYSEHMEHFLSVWPGAWDVRVVYSDNYSIINRTNWAFDRSRIDVKFDRRKTNDLQEIERCYPCIIS